ncbi:MAG: dephospho-CoA kinase [Pseudomonadota bacterium]
MVILDKKYCKIVGLTGGIACGKTQVSDAFKHLGVPIQDADIISRQLVQPGEKCLNDIVQYFGENILLPNGQLNRTLLRQQIFTDTSKRKTLESILHPYIYQRMWQNIKKLNGLYCIFSVPLLVESLGKTLSVERTNTPVKKIITRTPSQYFDRILIVNCTKERQYQHLKKRDKLDEAAISDILSAQFSAQDRISYADDIIENNGTLPALYQQVSKLHQFYLQKFKNEKRG